MIWLDYYTIIKYSFFKNERVGDLAYIIVDCVGNELLASFWGKILGLEITQRSGPYIDLARSGEHSPVISF